MKAIVIGGSGATGKFLVTHLLANSRYSSVVVLLRRAVFDPHPKLRQVLVDFDRLEQYTSEIGGDIAFSCMGTTLKAAGSKEAQWKIDYDYQFRFALLASQQKIPCFVLLSAQGANAGASFFYMKVKGQLEEAIKALGFDKLLLVQPGMLERPGTDRPMEKISLALIKFFNRIGLFKSLAPVHVEVLAKAIICKSLQLQEAVTIMKMEEIKQLSATT
ncbi:MAG: semialdehyde dehydrogenase [Ferruginibacter sp.]